MTLPIPTPERMLIALDALATIQANPGHYSKHVMLAWVAIDALCPEIAMQPGKQMLERLRGEGK
jgi:hypothetical protein